jgi:hypothetical protein
MDTVFSHTLLYLMANVVDTNVLYRHQMETVTIAAICSKCTTKGDVKRTLDYKLSRIGSRIHQERYQSGGCATYWR